MSQHRFGSNIQNTNINSQHQYLEINLHLKKEKKACLFVMFDGNI